MGANVLIKPIAANEKIVKGLRTVTAKNDISVLKPLSTSEVFKRNGILSTSLNEVIKHYGASKVPTYQNILSMGVNIHNQTKNVLFGKPNMTNKDFELLITWAHQISNMDLSVDLMM